MLRRYRVVIAEPGPDGHDRGANVIARALRDAGFEVVDTGRFETPDPVAEAVLQEDADAVGLPVPAGGDAALIPKVAAALRARGLDPFVFSVRDDVAAPDGAEVFIPESSSKTVGEWLEQALDRRATESAP